MYAFRDAGYVQAKGFSFRRTAPLRIKYPVAGPSSFFANRSFCLSIFPSVVFQWRLSVGTTLYGGLEIPSLCVLIFQEHVFALRIHNSSLSIFLLFPFSFSFAFFFYFWLHIFDVVICPLHFQVYFSKCFFLL